MPRDLYICNMVHLITVCQYLIIDHRDEMVYGLIELGFTSLAALMVYGCTTTVGYRVVQSLLVLYLPMALLQ